MNTNAGFNRGREVAKRCSLSNLRPQRRAREGTELVVSGHRLERDEDLRNEDSYLDLLCVAEGIMGRDRRRKTALRYCMRCGAGAVAPLKGSGAG